MSVITIFNVFKNSLWDFLYPPRCPICEEYIEEHSQVFCGKCLNTVLNIEKYSRSVTSIREVWRITEYTNGTRSIIHKLKFNNDLHQLPVINKILDMASKDKSLQSLLEKIDIAVAVPLHAEREKERGFNQVELIFKDWLNHRGILMERLILRTKATVHFYDLNPSQRKEVISDAFEIPESVKNGIIGKNFLVLDDIFTTGATMSECAKVFLKNGAKNIYGLAFASDFD